MGPVESGLLAVPRVKKFSETLLGEGVAFICMELNPKFSKLPAPSVSPWKKCRYVLSRARFTSKTVAQCFQPIFAQSKPTSGQLSLCSQLQFIRPQCVGYAGPWAMQLLGMQGCKSKIRGTKEEPERIPVWGILTGGLPFKPSGFLHLQRAPAPLANDLCSRFCKTDCPGLQTHPNLNKTDNYRENKVKEQH